MPRITPCIVAAWLSVGELLISRLDGSPSNAFAKPKSNTFTFPSGVNFHIGGFQVAVNDSFFVRRFERFGNLLRNSQSLFDRHRSIPLDALLQRVAGHQFHDEILRAVDCSRPKIVAMLG